MKGKYSISLVMILFFMIALARQVGLTAAEPLGPSDESTTFLPAVLQAHPTPTAQAIVADHRYTDASQIPDYWIDQAKKFVIHYAHTSHGNQILAGLAWLEGRDSRYNVDIQANGTVVLPDDTTALRIYDGNNYPGNTYITPDLYWESTDGMNHTRSVANTGWFNFSLWTWCGQMSYYSEAQIQEYTGDMDQFETEYPSMQFIYYTGHTDGSQPGSDLWRNNNLVRQYVQEHQKVLFDFADIESYDPDGNFYPSGSDACEWCSSWCTAHSTAFECQAPPSCDHTHGLQCTLKAQAYWWLMARLAGWDGTPAQ